MQLNPNEGVLPNAKGNQAMALYLAFTAFWFLTGRH